MTENEIIKKILYMGVGRSGLENESSIIAKSLSELMEYRAIGTVEELQVLNRIAEETAEYVKEDKKILEAYKRIGTIDELQALKEKATPKKPIETMMCYKAVWKCPACGCRLYSGQLHCEECGQAILDDYE